MEKINLQTNQLKLNVTNIKSFLIDSNKKLSKLRQTEKSLVQTNAQKQKFRSEERRLESPLRIGSISRVGRAIAGKTLSFFDRVKEFLGLLLAGFIVNALPSLIAKIKKFFDDNPIIGKSIKFIFDIIGKGFNGIVSLVNFFSSEKRDKIKEDINDLESGFKQLDSELGKDIAFIDGSPIDLGEESVTRNADDPNIMPDGSEIKIGDTVGGSDFAPPVQPARQKFSKGGKISPVSSTRSSVGAKKAVQTTNYFSDFRRNYVTFGMVNQENEKNRETFEKILAHFQTIESFRRTNDKKSLPMEGDMQNRSNDGSTYDGPPINYEGISDATIVGRVGSTGASTGPHIHIETGTGYGDVRGNVPPRILEKVMVGGRPLSQWPMTSPRGMRWHPVFNRYKMHQGIDYGIPSGTPIQLHKDLTLVEYDGGYNSGYGNTIVFKDKNGDTYLIGHLISGPEAKPKQDNASSPNSSSYGKGGGTIMPVQISHNIVEDLDDVMEETSVFVQPIIVKEKTPVLLPFG